MTDFTSRHIPEMLCQCALFTVLPLRLSTLWTLVRCQTVPQSTGSFLLCTPLAESDAGLPETLSEDTCLLASQFTPTGVTASLIMRQESRPLIPVLEAFCLRLVASEHFLAESRRHANTTRKVFLRLQNINRLHGTGKEETVHLPCNGAMWEGEGKKKII